MALNPLLDSILEELTTLVVPSEQEGSLVWGLEDELEKLRKLLAGIKPMVADAEEKQIRDKAVRMWLHAMEKTAYDAKVVVDEFIYEIRRRKAAAATTGIKNVGQVSDFFPSRNQILFRLKMRRKLKGILKRIEEIESEGGNFDFASTHEQPETTLLMRRAGPFVVESDVVGRNEDKETIVMMLINNSKHLAVLPIVGMAGIGKTTMAQLIYNDPRVVNHFQLRAWIFVSDAWDIEKIINGLISAITRRKLDLRFLNIRFVEEALIVLDDIWEEDPSEWHKLRCILDCSDKSGSAIVVTTRSRRVAEITGTLPSYHVPMLPKSESWTLFSKEAFAPGTETPEELVEIGKDIVKNCGGLPLAIRTLGRSLCMKREIRDWLKARDRRLWDMEEN